jgi:hypothetical protein
MNLRKAVLIAVPSLVALANFCGNFAFLGIFMACGDSSDPCTPDLAQITLSSIFLFPISLLPTGFGYLGFLANAAVWAAATYGLLRLVFDKAKMT